MNANEQNQAGFELELMIGVHRKTNAAKVVDLTYFLTAHDVKRIDGKTVLSAGRPLQEETLFQLGRYLSSRTPDKSIRRFGMLPERLLYIDGEQQRYVWWVKSHREEIYFANDLKLKDREILHPNLLFACQGENLFVYAFEGKKPLADTPLLKAPYFNLYEKENNICKGSTNVMSVRKARTHEDLLHSWENIFFRSKFSDGTSKTIPQKSKLSDEKYLQLLSSSKQFPYKTLIELPLTISSVCK